MATGGTDIPLTTTTKNSTPQYSKHSLTTHCEVYRSRVWEDLRNLFQQDYLTDVMLAAEGRSIPCHKVLLTAASNFFHDKFIINPKSLEHNILDIDNIDFDTLTSIVSYIYSGNASKTDLTVKKTEKLMSPSVKLMLPELTDACKDILGTFSTDVSACVEVYKIAKSSSLESTAQEAWKTALDNFQNITTTNAFKDLSETELETIYHLYK